MQELTRMEIRQAVAAALAEDAGPGDATTLAVVPAGAQARAVIATREPLVLAGIDFARETFAQLDPAIQCSTAPADGGFTPAGARLLEICGPARGILTGERVALNFLQRLSGVATATRRFVDAIAGTNAKILDTRKTTPGWRRFEKYAVACGGGQNHRFGLFDLILIKDNHLAALRDAAPNPVAAAIARARAAWPALRIEAEADNLAQAGQAADAGADIILLDNMSLDQLRAAVQLVQKRALLEASGGVNLDTVRAIAETGVDYISVGAITHSARAVDIGLDFL